MQASPSYKVLVVEDEGLIAHDISRRLESLGHRVLATVSTAAEAIEQAAGADLVLMDIHIDGDRDGIDAAMEIRARYHVPVVFLTAHADRATLDRAKLAGPFGYVVKPLGAGALHAAIEMATYKHRTERQLEEREAWYRATLDSAADAVITVDTAGRVCTLNRAAEALTGWSRDRAAGRRLAAIARFVDERTGLDTGDPVAVALVRDAAVALPPDARLVSGTARPEVNGDPASSDQAPRGADHSATASPDTPPLDTAVEGSASPVRVAAETLGAVLTLRDVGLRRWEERQLRQSQRLEATGRLAASVAADYGHLLAGIRNQASLLLEQFGEYSPARRAAEEIHRAASTAGQLTSRLAAFGTRQTGEPQVISLNRILRHLTKLIESVARGRVQVTLQLEPGAGQVQVDPALMEQAIMNLVLHACAVSSPVETGDGEDFPERPAGGVLKLRRLAIQTKRTQLAHRTYAAAFVSLIIEYSGDEADLDRLFDPAPSGEAGLALSVAHSIVQEHGGFLTARAVRSGGARGVSGTRLEILLPLAGEDVPSFAPDETASLPLAVLLVEGREEVRAELHNFFEAAGFNLLEVADCDEAAALAQLHEGPLHLVIVDASVADNLLDAVRAAHPSVEALRIVDAAERSRLEIRRPFSGQALVERVRSVMADFPEGRAPELTTAAISS
jgi:two-component system cell cycle sensor histidine kinase/response regulator CckA